MRQTMTKLAVLAISGVFLQGASARAATIFADNFSSTLGSASSQSGTAAPLTYTKFNSAGSAPATSNNSVPFSSGEGDAGFGISNDFGNTGTINVQFDFLFPAQPSRFLAVGIGTAAEITSSATFANLYNSSGAFQNGLCLELGSTGGTSATDTATVFSNNTVKTTNSLSPIPSWNSNDTYHANITYAQDTGAYSVTITDSTASSTVGTISGNATVTPTHDYLAFGVHNNTVTLSNLSVSTTPEPATLSLLGLGGLVLMRRRR